MTSTRFTVRRRCHRYSDFQCLPIGKHDHRDWGGGRRACIMCDRCRRFIRPEEMTKTCRRPKVETSP